MRPDLSDPEKLEAYRSELRGLARGRRLAGFLLVCLGAAGLLYVRLAAPEEAATLRFLSWLALAAGWAILIAAIVYRTRYHKARMAEEESDAL